MRFSAADFARYRIEIGGLGHDAHKHPRGERDAGRDCSRVQGTSPGPGSVASLSRRRLCDRACSFRARGRGTMTDDLGAYGYLYRLAREGYPGAAQLCGMVARRLSPEEWRRDRGSEPLGRDAEGRAHTKGTLLTSHRNGRAPCRTRPTYRWRPASGSIPATYRYRRGKSCSE